MININMEKEPVSPENCLKTHTEKKSMDMNNNNNNNEQQTFKMTANNPYHLPIKAVITNDDNPIMDSLKTKMKEMNINKDRLDRTHSVSSTGKKNQYLSQTSRNTAERPASPSPLVPPKSPTFRMTLERGGNPFAGPSGDVISSLKQQIAGDRMTLGLKQTRGLKASPSMSRIQKHLSGGVQPLPASKLSEDNSVPDPFDSHEYYSSSVSTSLPRSLDFSYRDIIRDMTQVKTKKPEDHYEKLIFEKKRRLTPPSLRRSNSLRSKSVSSMSASPVTKRSDSFTKNFYDKYNIDEQKRSMKANICKSTSFDEQSLAGNENKEEQRHPLKSRHTIDNSGLSPSKNEPPGKTATLPYFIDNIVIPEQEKKIEKKESLISHAISKPIPFTQSSFHDNLIDANNDYFENLQKTLEEIYSPTELLKFDLSTNAPIKDDDIFLYPDNKKSRKSNRDNLGSNKANTDNINLKNKTVENVNQSYIDTKGVTKIVENKKPLHTNNFEFVNQKSYQKTDLEDPINVKEAYTSPEKANYRERKKAATDYKKGIPKDCLKDKKDEPKKKVTELSKMNHFENDSSTIITKSENFLKPIICLGSLTSTCTVTDVISGTRPKKHVRFKDDIDLIEKFIFDNTKYFNDRFRIEDLAAYEEFIKQIQEAESFFRDNSYYNDIGYDDTDNAPDNKKDNASINNLDNADLQFVADIPTNNYDENAANELNSTSVEPNHNEVDKTMKIDHYIQTLYEKYSIDELLRSRKPVVTNRIDSLLQKYDFHLDNIDSPIPDEYQQKIADQKAARLHQVSPNIEMFKQSHQPSTDRFVPTNYSARSSPPRQSFLRKQAASSPNENTNELSQILRNRHKKLRDYEEEIEKEKILDNLSITKTPYIDTSTILQDIDKNDFIQDDTSIESLLESLDDFVAKREADSLKKDLSKEISQSPNKQSDDTKENNKEEMISCKDAKSENIKSKIRLQKRVSLDYPTKKTNPLERADDQDPCIHDDNVILNFLSFEKNKGVRPYFDSDKPNLDYSPRKYRSLSEGSVPKIDRPLSYSSGQRSKSPTVDYNIHVKRGSISMTTMSTKRGVKQATPVLAMNHVNKPLTLFLRKDTLPPSSSDEEEL